ncbi:MAG: YlmH/Sll1252 family protein [Culicoidibacterales bacterium]
MEPQIFQHFSDAEKIFVKQIMTLKRRILSENYVGRLNFLSIREQNIVSMICGNEVKLTFFGGYETAERKIVILAPLDININNDEIEILKLKFNDKFYSVKHNEVLGSLIGLGVRREMIGDIIISPAYAQVVVSKKIARYIIQSLEKVGNVSIIVEPNDSPIVDVEEQLNSKILFIKSIRIDNLIAAILSESRNKVQTLLLQKKIQVNWKITDNPNSKFAETDVISIRKVGRVYIKSIMSIKNGTKFKIEIEQTQ